MFTNGNDMARVESDLNFGAVNARICVDSPVHNQDNDKLYLLLDKDVNSRKASEELLRFAGQQRTGSLHYVYHTTPVPDDRQAFVNALKASSPNLIIGPGFEGEHNSDPALKKAYPYQRLAGCLKKGHVTQEDFDDLWRFLNGDPILEELILLLKTHAMKKAEGTEIGTLADLNGALVSVGQGQGNGTTIADETARLVTTRLGNGSGYAALRQALVSAIVEREGAKRRQ